MSIEILYLITGVIMLAASIFVFREPEKVEPELKKYVYYNIPNNRLFTAITKYRTDRSIDYEYIGEL